MKKKTIIALGTLLFCAFTGVYGSYAYFTAEEETVNIITAGNLKIALAETVVAEDGCQLETAVLLNEVMPGKRISRIVQVENTGDNPAYVRICVDKNISLAKGVAGQPDPDLVRYNLNTEYWIEGDDGYYYYRASLGAGELTEPLFEEIMFDGAMGNMYQNSVVEFGIRAQATQVAHNGENVMEARGWPDKDAQ